MKTITPSKARNGKDDAEIQSRLPVLDMRNIRVKITGDTSYISHRWSEKAITQIGNRQGHKDVPGEKPPRVPSEEYEASMHRTPEGKPGIPAVMFKGAAVTAGGRLRDRYFTKGRLNGAFYVLGDIIPIEGEPHLRQDMVRIGMGKPDIRYRAEFNKWSVVLTIRYDNSEIKPEQICRLLQLAGAKVGIGEWRPEKRGTHGMFSVTNI